MPDETPATAKVDAKPSIKPNTPSNPGSSPDSKPSSKPAAKAAPRPKPAPLESAPLAYENNDFLNSPDGRPLRIMSEYAEPLSRFRRERIQDTVVFFGSARFRALNEANKELELLANSYSVEAAPEDEQPARPEQVANGTASIRQLRLGAAAVEMAAYYEDARKLAHMMTAWTMTLPGRRHRFVITSGGGPGIMEAANRGAYEAGGKTIGLNIKLPFEQAPNPYITPELNFEFHYFFMRKYWFAYLAKALVVFPGGFGTLDEMFEILTLAQTQKIAKQITIVIYGSSYWKNVIDLEMLAEKGAISFKDVDLFQFADTPEQAFNILKEGLTKNHLESDYEKKQQAIEARIESTGPAPGIEEILGPDIAKTLP